MTYSEDGAQLRWSLLANQLATPHFCGADTPESIRDRSRLQLTSPWLNVIRSQQQEQE